MSSSCASNIVSSLSRPSASICMLRIRKHLAYSSLNRGPSHTRGGVYICSRRSANCAGSTSDETYDLLRQMLVGVCIYIYAQLVTYLNRKLCDLMDRFGLQFSTQAFDFGNMECYGELGRVPDAQRFWGHGVLQ